MLHGVVVGLAVGSTTVGCKLEEFVSQGLNASEGEVSLWEHMYHEVQVRGKEMCERTSIQHRHNDKVSYLSPSSCLPHLPPHDPLLALPPLVCPSVSGCVAGGIVGIGWQDKAAWWVGDMLHGGWQWTSTCWQR